MSWRPSTSLRPWRTRGVGTSAQSTAERDLAQAAEIAAKVRASAPSRALVDIYLAALQVYRGDFDEAVAALDRAIEAAPATMPNDDAAVR